MTGTDSKAGPAGFETIGVVGAGAMGRGIAQVMATAGARVRLIDVSKEALDAARKALVGSLDRAVDKGRMARGAADAALSRVAFSTAIADLKDADLVIEAVVERRDVKAAIFAEAATVAPDAVLASNTSSLSIAAIGQAAGTAGKIFGLHFFNPAHVMKLVEVVVLPETPEEVRERLVFAMRAAGKTPVVCGDTPGFIVNRCARPFYGEALAILEEGRHTAGEIDAAMRSAGYRLGPFALIDLVGADINLAASETIWEALERHPRYHVFAALKRQVAEGRLGRKTGKGFVTHESEAVAPPADADAIVWRIEAMLVNEAITLYDTGMVNRADIDLAMTLGLNFPRGPFAIAEAMGSTAIARILADLAAAAPDPLKPRYQAAAGLAALDNDPRRSERP